MAAVSAWAVAWDQGLGPVSAAVWAAAWGAAWGAAREAALATVTRDLITPGQFDKLYGPWASVMEGTDKNG